MQPNRVPPNPASSFDFEHSEMSINHSISTNMICETHCRRTVLKTVVISCAPSAFCNNAYFSHKENYLTMMSAYGERKNMCGIEGRRC